MGSAHRVSSFCSVECGNAILYSIVMVSIGSLSTGSPSLSTFSSGECGNAILQYCYGFNRLQLWLLAQGLIQSVLSLQVSVTMPYYSIVMVSIYRRQLWLLAQGLLQSVLSLPVSAAMPYYTIVMVSIGISSSSAS